MLSFFFVQESGGYTLKGGPVDALIAYAASSAKSGKYVKCIILMESKLLVSAFWYHEHLGFFARELSI